MINVVLPDVFEIRIPEVLIVYAMVNPFFEYVGLHDAGHQHRSGVGREEKAQQDRDRENRQHVFPFAVDMLTVKGPLVMLPV